MARALPRASACRARASQATLRGSGGPRRRDLRGALKMLGRTLAVFMAAQADAPGEQVGLHRLAAPRCVETSGDLLGVPEQGGRMLANGGPLAWASGGKAGARLLEGPPLSPEQPVCLTCPLPGFGRVACR